MSFNIYLLSVTKKYNQLFLYFFILEENYCTASSWTKQDFKYRIWKKRLTFENPCFLVSASCSSIGNWRKTCISGRGGVWRGRFFTKENTKNSKIASKRFDRLSGDVKPKHNTSLYMCNANFSTSCNKTIQGESRGVCCFLILSTLSIKDHLLIYKEDL